MKQPTLASLKRQRGAETLEFVIVFGLFVVLVMMVFDFSRVLYAWNILAEATRRGARMAAVCPNDAASQNIVKNVAVFDVIDGTLGTSPVLKGLTTDAINIAYFDVNGTATNDPIDIAFVEVSIQNFIYNSIIPDMPYMNVYTDKNPLTAPSFKATLYAESKGAVPTLPGVTPITPTCDF